MANGYVGFDDSVVRLAKTKEAHGRLWLVA